MKSKVQTIIGLALVVIAFMAAQAVAQRESRGGGGRLEGTWDTAVTVVNCANGAPIRTFASLGSFNQGGTFTGITAGTPPAARTPEIGVWRHVRGNDYVFRFKAFMFDTSGNPVGYQVVTHEIELDQDNQNYTSAGGVQIFNMAGVQIGSGCSTAVGARMVLD